MTQTKSLKSLVIEVLDDMKAQDISALDVEHLTSICDTMFVCTGTSSRHIKSIAEALVEAAKSNQFPVGNIEGKLQAEWVLADLGDVVVHIMQPEVRAFYQLEKLWSEPKQKKDSKQID